MKTILRPILALLSCIVLYICLTPTAFADTVASGACGASLNWVLDDKGTLTVSGQGEMYELNVLYDGGVFLSYSPWNDYNSSIKRIDIKNGVSTIASQAFANCYKAAEALIPASVTSIGDRAFAQCYSLSEINIPYGVISIGKSAFDSCTSALTIRLPESVTTIGKMAFDYCPKVTSLTIPSSVESIGDYAFSNLWALTEIVIPGNIKAVGHSVFNNCHALESVTISKGVESIGQYAFNADESLSRIVFEGSIPAIHEEAFRYVTADAFYPAGDSSYTPETMKNYGGTLTWIPYTVENIVASGECGVNGNNLIWTLDDSGLLTINGTGQMANYNIGAAPWYSYRKAITSIIIEDGVNSIGQNAFYFCSNITSAVISKTVFIIGDYAFENCSNIENVIIPQGTSSIGSYAFKGCSSLTSVSIPSSITSIGSYAFMDCSSLNAVHINSIEAWCGIDFGWEGSGNPLGYAHNLYLNDALLQELSIPSSIRTIKTGVFRGSSLTNVTIPDGVTSIGGYAFMNCENLGTIVIPNSISSIGEFCFGQCPLLQSIIIPGSIAVIERYAFAGCTSLTQVTIEDGVAEIGYRAFRSCKRLESLFIPKSVTSIGAEAFGQCDALACVVFSNGLITIENEAFRDCVLLDNVDLPDSVTSIGYSAFQNCTALSRIRIPERLSRISHYAFYNCSNLAEINIPECITSIDDYAFVGCKSLTALSLPDSLFSLGQSAFLNCTGLEILVIPDAVSQISHSCFSGCSSLKAITIPSGITVIQPKAFDGCNRLEDIYYDGTEAQWLEISIGDDNTYLHQANCHYKYIAEGICGENLTWSLSGNGVLIISGVGDMPDNSYPYPWDDYKGSITEVVIESGITTIGNSAFYECRNLKNVTIPSSVTSIKPFAFGSCSNLTSITIPLSVENIGASAFYNCKGLEQVIILSALTDLEPGIFYYCDLLKTAGPIDSGCNIEFSWTEEIPDYAFYDCGSLTDVTIPNSVTRVGTAAFLECRNLANAILPVGTTSIGDSAFYNCHALAQISIPSDVIYMGDYAFYGCNSISSITVPEGISSIGNYAFADCSSLARLTIPTSVSVIKMRAFSGCDNLTDVFYEGSRMDWGTIDVEVDNDLLLNATLHCAKAEIIYNANGGYGIMDQQIVDIDASFNLRPNAFSRPEKIFLEWNTEPNGSGTSYLDQETISGISEGIVLYAQWGIVITFDANGGIGAMEPMIASGSNIVLPYNRFIREEYAFISWNTMPDGNGVSYLDAEMISLDELANLTLYAQWEKIAFTVMYIPNGGSGIMETQKLIKGMSLTLQLNTFTRENYLFIGWSTTANGMVSYPDGDTINELFADISLYAQWVPVSSVDPDFVLPEELTAIGDEAFASGAFSYVKLSENTTSIGWHAFADCPNLMYIYIPEKTTDIDPQAFGDRTKLTIVGKIGSTAETYATAHGYTFVAIS